MKEGYQKIFKKLNLFFLSNPFPFNGQDYEKQKGPGIYSGFWVIPKIASVNLYKPIHGTINYSTFICPFESGISVKERNLQKFACLENEKSFLDEIKSIFYSFWRAIIWCKNKNNRHKL